MLQRNGIMFNYKSAENMDKLRKASSLAFEFNHSKMSRDEANSFLQNWLGSIDSSSLIKSPFNCDFGTNVHIGKNTIINLNSVMFDRSEIRFGDNVLVGPNCSFYTSIHPLDYQTRNENMMICESITIEDNVWIAGNVVVMPGVTIKSGAVIGAGSVVTSDIESNCLAVGNPAVVIKQIDQHEVDSRFKK